MSVTSTYCVMYSFVNIDSSLSLIDMNKYLYRRYTKVKADYPVYI